MGRGPLFTLVVVVALLAPACRGVAGSGTSATEGRTIAAFDTLTVRGPFEVRLTVGGEPAMTLSGDDNLLPLVETSQEGSALTIRAIETVRPSGALIVTLSTPSVGEIKLSGAVQLKASGIKSDALALSASGAVDALLTGMASDLRINASGAASIRARDLKAMTVRLDASGAVSAEVFASESLKATLSGAGTLDCWGAPKAVDKTVSGAGSVHIRK